MAKIMRVNPCASEIRNEILPKQYQCRNESINHMRQLEQIRTKGSKGEVMVKILLKNNSF
jgi:hypothetical protein